MRHESEALLGSHGQKEKVTLRRKKSGGRINKKTVVR